MGYHPPMLSRNDVAHRIAETSVLRGTFTLRSGRTSSYYIDKYLFSTQPDILQALGSLFAERIPADTTLLAGAELGGIPLVTAASMASKLPCLSTGVGQLDTGDERHAVP